MKLNIYHHKSDSGRDVIEEYINELDQETQDLIYAFLVRFRDDEQFRREPHCKKVFRDIFELRISAKDSYRILYAFVFRDSVILLNIFKKQTNKLPKKELELVIKRLKLYEK